MRSIPKIAQWMMVGALLVGGFAVGWREQGQAEQGKVPVMLMPSQMEHEKKPEQVEFAGGVSIYMGMPYYDPAEGKREAPTELLLIDPEGRRTGFDPLTGQSYSEIPGSGYEAIGLEDALTGDPGPYTKELETVRPIAGEYTLHVTGTGEGTYTLEIRADDPARNLSKATFIDVPISPSVVHRYRFDYARTVGAALEVSGGFDGGGQAPGDVNEFLTYSNPSESRTSLPAGTTTFPLMIFYGKAIIPASFKAVFNGVDISSRFSPTPGSHQTVTLNLQGGMNVLVLSVDGNLPTQIATDTDRLVFSVP